MTQPSAARIPVFYRLFFTWVDPIICAWGAYMDFFDPSLVLSSHIPHLSPDVGHTMILRQRGGGMLNFGFISAVLLRYTSDIKIWTIIQIADFIVDVAYFWAIYGALSEQGRLAVDHWRAEDWGSVVITGAATVMRIGFLMGLGFKGYSKSRGKSS